MGQNNPYNENSKTIKYNKLTSFYKSELNKNNNKEK
jgi:hypothetical protein